MPIFKYVDLNTLTRQSHRNHDGIISVTSKITNVSLCGGNGWYPEQALDVESEHTMAPGANIEFVGAQNCLDTGLLSALQTAVTSGASVVSDSWGDTLGDLLTDAATKTAFDNTFMTWADAHGVGYLAWGWYVLNEPTCSSIVLITDSSGTPVGFAPCSRVGGRPCLRVVVSLLRDRDPLRCVARVR